MNPPWSTTSCRVFRLGAVAREPAHRALARGALQRLHGAGDGCPFILALHQVVLLPAVTVAADLMPLRGNPPRHLRVALQGQGAAEEGGLHPVALEHVHQPPDPHAAPVLEEGLVVQVAVSRRHRRRHLVVGLVVRVAVEGAAFRALLVVHHQRHRYTCSTGPLDLRRVPAISHQVSFHESPPGQFSGNTEDVVPAVPSEFLI